MVAAEAGIEVDSFVVVGSRSGAAVENVASGYCQGGGPAPEVVSVELPQVSVEVRAVAEAAVDALSTMTFVLGAYFRILHKMEADLIWRSFETKC